MFGKKITGIAQFFLFSFLFAFTQPTLGQQISDENRVSTMVNHSDIFGLIQDVYLDISDQALNNCWTSSATLKSKAKLIFEQSDIPVIEEPSAFPSTFHPNIRLVVIGRRGPMGCWGSIHATVKIYERIEYGDQLAKDGDVPHYYTGLYPVNLYSQKGVNISPDNFNKEVMEFFEGFVSEVAAKIIAGRRKSVAKNILERYPHYKMRISESEYKKFEKSQ